ncbi:MAG: SemiSWEET transporter [Tunicatimonas sp.]
MSTFMLDVLGIIAGMLTTAAFLPQVIKTWKSKSAKDLSLGMFLLFVLGVILWLVYGIFSQALPIILANAATLLLSSVLLYFKLAFKS